MRSILRPWFVCIVLSVIGLTSLFLWWQRPQQKLHSLFSLVKMGANDYRNLHGDWPKAESDVAAFVHGRGDPIKQYFKSYRYEFKKLQDGKLQIRYYGEAFDGEKYDFLEEIGQ